MKWEKLGDIVKLPSVTDPSLPPTTCSYWCRLCVRAAERFYSQKQRNRVSTHMAYTLKKPLAMRYEPTATVWGGHRPQGHASEPKQGWEFTAKEQRDCMTHQDGHPVIVEIGCCIRKGLHSPGEEEEGKDRWGSKALVRQQILVQSAWGTRRKQPNSPTSPTMSSLPKNRRKSVTLSKTATLEDQRKTMSVLQITDS